MPYQNIRVYTGIVWYKEEVDDNWLNVPGDYMYPTYTGLQAATFSGNQLGTPDSAMFFRRCVSVHANIGNGNDKRTL